MLYEDKILWGIIDLLSQYYSQYLSVLSEVKDGSFKTYRIPFDYNKYRENDLSRSINLSDDMSILKIIQK